jgi:hypothetical protein
LEPRVDAVHDTVKAACDEPGGPSGSRRHTLAPLDQMRAADGRLCVHPTLMLRPRRQGNLVSLRDAGTGEARRDCEGDAPTA